MSAKWCDVDADSWGEISEEAEPPRVDHNAIDIVMTSGLKVANPVYSQSFVYSDTTVLLVDQADPVDR